MTNSSLKTGLPRNGSASDRLIRLLRSRSGRDLTTLSTSLGWQPHSVRGALSRLRRAGIVIEKLPPGRTGGGTRYRIARANEENTR